MVEREEETIVKIPESITLNGVVYYVKDNPELQQFIQKVAKVEKSKLYTQFENLKSQIANLGRVQVTGSSTDLDSLISRMKSEFVTKEDFNQNLPKVLEDVVRPILNATEQSRKDDLNSYREKLIKDNAATCIPELIKGDTKEELDKSLQESIRIRASYPNTGVMATASEEKPVVDPLIKKQEEEQRHSQENHTPTSAPIPTMAPPQIPRRQSPDAGASMNIKQMSMDEFSRQRESLKNQLESMYGSDF